MDSLWTKTVTLPQFPTLDHDERADVLVIGGGITGLLCAYALQQKGLSVIVTEADRIARGTTAGTTAKLTAQHGGSFYTTLIERRGVSYAKHYRRWQEQAVELFDALAEQFPCDAETVDAFLYSRQEPEALWEEQDAIRRSGGTAERRTVSMPFSAAGVLRLPNQRQFHPLKLLAGVAETLKIYEHTRIAELHEQRAITDKGITVLAQHMVVATHFPFVNRRGLYPVKLYQQRSYALAVEGAAPLPGMLLDAATGGIFARNYGDTVLLSGAGHRTGKPGEAWRPLEETVRQWFPHAAITCRWAAQDCCTADEVAYIGAYSPYTPGWLVATGFNGWGMSGALVSSRLVAETVVGKKNKDADMFAPNRRVPRNQLLKNAGESVLGLITPTVPRCSHLGCALHWNPWEHSWDCACHGSRFSESGNLLHGPAKHGINNPPTKNRAGE